MKDKDVSSLEHTSWRCQYHVVFAPKYRRMEIYGQIKQDIGVILRKLCQQKGVEIIEAEACRDHIHMLISIPPKHSVSQIMAYLKGKSSFLILDFLLKIFGNKSVLELCDTASAAEKVIKRPDFIAKSGL